MQLVEHRDVVVANLASGSKGNCTFIGDAHSGVLVDCGISTKQTLARLAAVGLGDATIDAVLITHEHSDHVAAAAILDRALRKRQDTPATFYATAGTSESMNPKVRPTELQTVHPGLPLFLAGGAIRLEPHRVPHDTLEPVAWVVERRGVRTGVLTDFGHLTRGIARVMGTLDVAVLEFNHDDTMLMEGPYPWQLKQRIRGRHGHLSNAEAARLLRDAASDRLRHAMLGHLSEENNTPEHALRAAEEAASSCASSDLTLHVLQQATPSVVRARGRLHAVGAPLPAPAPTTAPGRTDQASLFGG